MWWNRPRSWSLNWRKSKTRPPSEWISSMNRRSRIESVVSKAIYLSPSIILLASSVIFTKSCRRRNSEKAILGINGGTYIRFLGSKLASIRTLLQKSWLATTSRATEWNISSVNSKEESVSSRQILKKILQTIYRADLALTLHKPWGTMPERGYTGSNAPASPISSQRLVARQRWARPTSGWAIPSRTSSPKMPY